MARIFVQYTGHYTRMTRPTIFLWTCLFQLAALVGVSTAALCYNCNGTLTAPGCGNPFDAGATATCTGETCLTWNVTNNG